MKTPTKPFPAYKWRWATLECTESLNDPSVYLGVLRVFREFEGCESTDPQIRAALAIVKEETGTRVDLVRAKHLARPLIRNSGQYWKALDLIGDIRGVITLTSFGKEVADREITQAEFAATVVKTLELPNRRLSKASEIKLWDNAGLSIKPLQLILNILAKLSSKAGKDEAYVTRRELVRIIIPLAGAKASVSNHTDAILLNRQGDLIVADWPNCAPRPHDPRMAREFLLFLANYGFCTLRKERINDLDRYYLASLRPEDVEALAELDTEGDSSSDVASKVRKSLIADSSNRRRIMMSVLARPNQTAFRRNVLGASDSRCLLTGAEMPSVLQAAHIIPIRSKGTDETSNGICLRADVHLLFDSGNLGIRENGTIWLSPPAGSPVNYKFLPEKVSIPHFVSRDNLAWRWKYC